MCAIECQGAEYAAGVGLSSMYGAVTTCNFDVRDNLLSPCDRSIGMIKTSKGPDWGVTKVTKVELCLTTPALDLTGAFISVKLKKVLTLKQELCYYINK